MLIDEFKTNEQTIYKKLSFDKLLKFVDKNYLGAKDKKQYCSKFSFFDK
jgi:hypothetical protein